MELRFKFKEEIDYDKCNIELKKIIKGYKHLLAYKSNKLFQVIFYFDRELDKKDILSIDLIVSKYYKIDLGKQKFFK